MGGAAIRALLFTVLRRRGFRVDRARNGVEALGRCARCRYSLVLLDLMMPRMSGYEVLREIETWPPEDRPFIIVLTAGNEPRNLSADLVGGTLRKPFDIEMLIETMSACLATREMAAQPNVRRPKASSRPRPIPNDPSPTRPDLTSEIRVGGGMARILTFPSPGRTG